MPSRPAFTLTELLVVIAIILGLMTLVSSAASAARTSQKINATRSLIDRLDTILQSQLQRYASANVDAATLAALTTLPNTIPNRSAARAWFIRRNLITGDLPDRWTDVQFMATPANGWVPQSAAQRAYISLWNAASPKPTSSYAGAECLFMIIMQGGLADSYDIGPLKTSDIGDKDQDGAQEFLDSWGNPIDYILWPAGLELPAGSGNKFFSGNRAPVEPFAGSPSASLNLRPLIYSPGPDGGYSFERLPLATNLSPGTAPSGRDCGNWQVEPTLKLGGLYLDEPDRRADNITNFDAEVKQ